MRLPEVGEVGVVGVVKLSAPLLVVFLLLVAINVVGG